MKILVIMTSYNGEKYIQEQIDSILKQEEVQVEIFIFDDVSKDNTIQVIEKYANESRVKLIKNELPNGSAAKNFFSAIKYLKEKLKDYNYISFSDQDDIWFPNKLCQAVNILKRDQSELYMSNLILWEEKTNNKIIINKSYPQKKYDFLFEGGSAGCTYVFTSTFAQELEKIICEINYKNWVSFSHDWFVYFFARIKNHKVSIDNEAYIYYRIHSNNVHGQLNTNSFFALKERFKLIREGWYFEHIKGYTQLVPKDSVFSKIYYLYSKNLITRLFIVMKYNFQLMRSRKKMIQFAVLSLLPIKRNKN